MSNKHCLYFAHYLCFGTVYYITRTLLVYGLLHNTVAMAEAANDTKHIPKFQVWYSRPHALQMKVLSPLIDGLLGL